MGNLPQTPIPTSPWIPPESTPSAYAVLFLASLTLPRDLLLDKILSSFLAPLAKVPGAGLVSSSPRTRLGTPLPPSDEGANPGYAQMTGRVTHEPSGQGQVGPRYGMIGLHSGHICSKSVRVLHLYLGPTRATIYHLKHHRGLLIPLPAAPGPPPS